MAGAGVEQPTGTPTLKGRLGLRAFPRWGSPVGTLDAGLVSPITVCMVFLSAGQVADQLSAQIDNGDNADCDVNQQGGGWGAAWSCGLLVVK